jgi:hypothetical protein
MLGNIIGKRKSAHHGSNSTMHKPEYRLKSSRGQDRSVNVDFDSSNALETDKGNQRCYDFGWRYSPNTCYNMKQVINNQIWDSSLF